VNASFTHGNPAGRFNGAGRRAWYAGFELKTSQREVAFHRAAELKEIAGGWKDEEVSPYIDYIADFRHIFHDIRDDGDFLECLNPDTNKYGASQALAIGLLNDGSAGIVYPSVRHAGGPCIACFRPPLVLNVREGGKTTFTFVNAEVVSLTEDSY